MASSEADFQSELIKEFKAASKGFAIKISDKFFSGVVDLNVAYQGTTAWIELKYSVRPKLSATPLHLKLTKNQREFIKSYHEADCFAGWALCVKNPDRTWSLYAGTNPDQESATELDLVHVRRYGGKWDVKALMNFITRRLPA